ncbi:MAG TPA: hypothetical protein VF651_08315 [Gammaproteobacteria bacterium]
MTKKTGKTTRARAETQGMREIAQQHAVHALKKLVTLIDSKNERVALSAAQTVLDRAHGKVAQAMNLKGPEGGLTVKIMRFREEDGHAE